MINAVAWAYRTIASPILGGFARGLDGLLAQPKGHLNSYATGANLFDQSLAVIGRVRSGSAAQTAVAGDDLGDLVSGRILGAGGAQREERVDGQAPIDRVNGPSIASSLSRPSAA